MWGVQTRTLEHTVATVSGSLNTLNVFTAVILRTAAGMNSCVPFTLNVVGFKSVISMFSVFCSVATIT